MNEPDKNVVASLGQVQVYTGEAKGKTTACFGLALRAAGHGLRIYIGQFAKGRPTGEVDAMRRYLPELVTVEQYGRYEFPFLGKPPAAEDYRLAQEGFCTARSALHSGEYHMVILDEINVAVAFGLVMYTQLLDLMTDRPKRVELVLSGRYAHPAVIEVAGLVTEMTEKKHYFAHGVMARTGIEE